MAASVFHSSIASRNAFPSKVTRRSAGEAQQGWSGVFALLCVLGVILCVPESPSELASICQKYNSATACRVW